MFNLLLILISITELEKNWWHSRPKIPLSSQNLWKNVYCAGHYGPKSKYGLEGLKAFEPPFENLVIN